MSIMEMQTEWPEEQVRLIASTVAKDATKAELLHFLNIAARYDLDVFAKEIWFAKSPGKNGGQGQLLMMVGRDGLRKIAHRSGLTMDADVVREKDTFRISRQPDGSRGITHEYEGGADERGTILGAWCEVFKVGPPRQQVGFFYAPMKEYRPTSEAKLKYSPWGSQESVMIMAAAERQALRQATPLSGLIAEGETEINHQLIEAGDAEEATAVEYPEGTPDELIERLSAAFDRGNALEANAYLPAQVQMLVGGQTPEALAELADRVEAENVERERRAEAAAPPLAEVPEEGPEPGAEFAGIDDADLRKELEALDAADDAQAERGMAIEDELKRRGAENPNQLGLDDGPDAL